MAADDKRVRMDVRSIARLEENFRKLRLSKVQVGIFANNLGWDSSSDSALRFSAGGNGTHGGQFVNSWFSSSGTAPGFVNNLAVGIRYDSASTSAYGNLSFTGGVIYNNAAAGIYESNPTLDVIYSGVGNFNNSANSPNTYSNYQVNNGTQHVVISGGQWGKFGGGLLANTPKYGIESAGTTDYISLSGLDLSGTGSSGTCTFGATTLTGGISCGTIGSHSVQAAVMP